MNTSHRSLPTVVASILLCVVTVALSTNLSDGIERDRQADVAAVAEEAAEAAAELADEVANTRLFRVGQAEYTALIAEQDALLASTEGFLP